MEKKLRRLQVISQALLWAMDVLAGVFLVFFMQTRHEASCTWYPMVFFLCLDVIIREGRWFLAERWTGES